MQIIVNENEVVPEGRFLDIFTGEFPTKETISNGYFLPTENSEYYIGGDFDTSYVEVVLKHNEAIVERIMGDSFEIGDIVYLSDMDGLVTSKREETGYIVGKCLEEISDKSIRIILL